MNKKKRALQRQINVTRETLLDIEPATSGASPKAAPVVSDFGAKSRAAQRATKLRALPRQNKLSKRTFRGAEHEAVRTLGHASKSLVNGKGGSFQSLPADCEGKAGAGAAPGGAKEPLFGRARRGLR